MRDFAQAAGLTIAPEANTSLLKAIKASNVQAAGVSPARNDPIAHLLAPSKKVQAIQRALTDFGYGQINPTGVYDADTRAAIEKFERDRKLPVTGRIYGHAGAGAGHHDRPAAGVTGGLRATPSPCA